MQKNQKAVSQRTRYRKYKQKHRATATQRQSFKELNESGKRETQAQGLYLHAR